MSLLVAMTRIHEVIDSIDDPEVSRLAVAIELLAGESGAFVMFMRLGDIDTPADADVRAFAVVGVGLDNEKLRRTVIKWADEVRAELEAKPLDQCPDCHEPIISVDQHRCPAPRRCGASFELVQDGMSSTHYCGRLQDHIGEHETRPWPEAPTDG